METVPTPMTTLSTVLEVLRSKRQDTEFKMTDKGFTADGSEYYSPEDLLIIKTYRFEGDSNPSDSSILYLLEAVDGLIGYSIDAYGVYSNHDEKYDGFVRKIKLKNLNKEKMQNKDRGAEPVY